MNRQRQRVRLKSPEEIERMAEANRHVAEVLDLMCQAVAPGVSTWDLDQIARRELAQRGVSSPFLGYRGYPATICASVNEEIVHGIPRKDKILREGDIIGLDFGVICRGYVGDSARTVPVGPIDPATAELLAVTEACLERAIEVCTPEYRLSDIGRVVQTHAEAHGFGVVRDFVGHGIGTAMHEEPQVFNYYDGPRARLKAGLVIAIEPMLCAGTHRVRMLADGWTAVTYDGRMAAHFEHSIAILPSGPRVLSRLAGSAAL